MFERKRCGGGAVGGGGGDGEEPESKRERWAMATAGSEREQCASARVDERESEWGLGSAVRVYARVRRESQKKIVHDKSYTRKRKTSYISKQRE